MHVRYGVTAPAAYNSLVLFKTNGRKMGEIFPLGKQNDKKELLKIMVALNAP